MNYKDFKISEAVSNDNENSYLLLQVVGKKVIIFNLTTNRFYEKVKEYSYDRTSLKEIQEDDLLFDALAGYMGENVVGELIKSQKGTIKGKIERMKGDEKFTKVIETIAKENMEFKREDREKLRLDILALREKGQKINLQLLADWLRAGETFRLHEDGSKHYKLESNGYVEINKYDIIEMLSEILGFGVLNCSNADKLLEMVAQQRIEQNNNIIQFTNGVLDTSTGIFNNDISSMEYLPKMDCILEFPEIWENWEQVEEAYKQTDLYNEVKAMLSSDWSWNEDLFYHWVANCLMATNELESLLILHGKPNTGKSTLASLFKRIFGGYTSNVPLQTINNNIGHDTSPLVGKCVNIDDDIGSEVLKDTGKIKLFVTGGGFTVNPKYGNQVSLTLYTTPKFIGCANKLPIFVGEGHKRRLLIIQVPNVLSDTTTEYQNKIIQGKRDDELSLLVAYSLKKYYEAKKEGKKIINSEMRGTMWDYYQSQLKTQNIKHHKLYKKAITECFIGKNELSKQLNQLKDEGKIEDYTYKGSTLKIHHNGKTEEIPNYTSKEEAVKIITEHIEKNNGEYMNDNHIFTMMKIHYEYKGKNINGKTERVFTDCIKTKKLQKLHLI